MKVPYRALGALSLAAFGIAQAATVVVTPKGLAGYMYLTAPATSNGSGGGVAPPGQGNQTCINVIPRGNYTYTFPSGQPENDFTIAFMMAGGGGGGVPATNVYPVGSASPGGPGGRISGSFTVPKASASTIYFYTGSGGSAGGTCAGNGTSGVGGSGGAGYFGGGGGGYAGPNSCYGTAGGGGGGGGGGSSAIKLNSTLLAAAGGGGGAAANVNNNGISFVSIGGNGVAASGGGGGGARVGTWPPGAATDTTYGLWNSASYPSGNAGGTGGVWGTSVGWANCDYASSQNVYLTSGNGGTKGGGGGGGGAATGVMGWCNGQDTAFTGGGGGGGGGAGGGGGGGSTNNNLGGIYALNYRGTSGTAYAYGGAGGANGTSGTIGGTTSGYNRNGGGGGGSLFGGYGGRYSVAAPANSTSLGTGYVSISGHSVTGFSLPSSAGLGGAGTAGNSGLIVVSYQSPTCNMFFY